VCWSITPCETRNRYVHDFPHTADAGLRVEAADLETLFAEAGRGLFSLIVSNLDDVEPRTTKEFVIDGDDVEIGFTLHSEACHG
jgi:SHS2 domain-containing protein